MLASHEPASRGRGCKAAEIAAAGQIQQFALAAARRNRELTAKRLARTLAPPLDPPLDPPRAAPKAANCVTTSQTADLPPGAKCAIFIAATGPSIALMLQIEPQAIRIPVRSKRQAMDWSLVLLSQEIQSVIDRSPDEGWGLIVARPDVDRPMHGSDGRLFRAGRRQTMTV